MLLSKQPKSEKFFQDIIENDMSVNHSLYVVKEVRLTPNYKDITDSDISLLKSVFKDLKITFNKGGDRVTFESNGMSFTRKSGKYSEIDFLVGRDKDHNSFIELKSTIGHLLGYTEENIKYNLANQLMEYTIAYILCYKKPPKKILALIVTCPPNLTNLNDKVKARLKRATSNLVLANVETRTKQLFNTYCDEFAQFLEGSGIGFLRNYLVVTDTDQITLTNLIKRQK